jgi:hypothetical protein
LPCTQKTNLLAELGRCKLIGVTVFERDRGGFALKDAFDFKIP